MQGRAFCSAIRHGRRDAELGDPCYWEIGQLTKFGKSVKCARRRCAPVKAKVAAVAAGIAVAAAAAYALSPYFTESEVNEAAPQMAGDAVPATMLSGTFVGVGDGIHDAEGTASVLEADGSRVLRLEDFRSTNGPDLYVYLATDSSASDYVSLGTLKGNSGNQNYPIPEGTDLQKYDEVLIWCKAFGVLFGSAQIA